MGLVNLNYADQILESRKKQTGIYDEMLSKANVQKPKVADDVASRILCPPMYFELSEVEIEKICRRILRVLNN